MHKKFDNKAIEKKWQQVWKESGIYDVGERDTSKEKEYVLVELPYPSGNLHIGHWHAFAVPDIYIRYGRMTGKQMLYPMGFDAFGLPAENAAIKRDINPKEWTEGNIEYMKDQLGSMGAAFSWDKTASTTDQDYYKWTQWMFIQFFERGIAYRGKGKVNWCNGCNTVIANEQMLSDDTCERCGTEIEKKEMPQWMLRITDYADRLVDDLETVTWPEHIKEAQRQWIGRSQGAEITFQLKTSDVLSTDEVKVFTTRPDTLFGATYMVLAPEHSLVQKNKDVITNWGEVDTYITTTKKKAEQDRLDDTKEKTGVKLEGITAVNPASGEEIPVYIADYVLAGYGTGAIMAVPAHDERDFAFATKFEIKVKNVIKPSIVSYSSSHKIGERPDVTEELTKVSEAIEKGAIVSTGLGTLVNSSEFDGMDSEEAKIAITEKVGGKMTNTYRLRDWSVGRQRYWGAPVPIVYDPEGKAHAVPKEYLPWVLPEDVDFRPTGVPPLAKSEDLKNRTEEIFGEGWTPEVETLDTFVDSSWYFLRYIDNKNDDMFASLEAQKEWMPIDLYFGGAEHTTMHLLYSRFWQKALLDMGLVTESEPYKHRINRGLILGPDGNKMSKSKGNVIDPDEHVQRVGADSVKMYLAFMGPYGETANYPWDMGGIAGIRRFLERVYGISEHIADTEPEEVTKQLHKTILKVSKDIPEYKFNTAISAMMVFVNLVEKHSLTQESYETFLQVLAPFAPHLTEELYQEAGKITSIHEEVYPVADVALATDSEKTIGVQINGKMRGSITVKNDASEDEAIKLAKGDEVLNKRLNGNIVKVIYVPNKILNIIVEEK
ncbi:MAG: leucyl-tRNA synthetase [Acidimicrobiales bacterium]|jgi:leucyl-tRNA synthetase